jgi:hypothetical protein
MPRSIQYRNTDLELFSQQNLTDFAATLTTKGFFPLYVADVGDGRWLATFETEESFEDPESNIVAMLAVIERLDSESRELWFACTKRDLDIGYECGDEPHLFHQALTAATLARIAALSLSLRITLYPASD